MLSARYKMFKVKIIKKKYKVLQKEAELKEILQIAKNAKIIFSENTVIGALAKYISTPNKKFQPMNANFGILPELEGKKIKDKKRTIYEISRKKFKRV